MKQTIENNLKAANFFCNSQNISLYSEVIIKPKKNVWGSNELCSMCLCNISTTISHLVRCHAPAHYPCQGSGKPPQKNYNTSQQEGVQHGNPLGPLLFCLAIHRHCEQLISPLRTSY